MLGDKDIAGVCRHLAGRVDHWHVGELPGNPRASRRRRSSQAIRASGASGTIAVHPTVAAAFAAAREAAEEGDRIVVFGSFLTVAEVMAVRGG